MSLEGMTKMFMGLASIAIVLVVAFIIVSQGQTTLADIENLNESNATDTATSVGYNATQGIQDSMSDAVDWLPIIVITIIGGMLIGLVAFFRGRRG